MPHRFQKIHRIPGKPRNALCQDDVYLACLAVGKHPFELIALYRVGTGNKIICIDPGILPVWVLLDQPAVVAHLCGKGVEHPFRLHGHSGISGHLFLFPDCGNCRFDFS